MYAVDPFGSQVYVALSGRMAGEYRKKRSWPNLGHWPGNFLQRRRKLANKTSVMITRLRADVFRLRHGEYGARRAFRWRWGSVCFLTSLVSCPGHENQRKFAKGRSVCMLWFLPEQTAASNKCKLVPVCTDWRCNSANIQAYCAPQEPRLIWLLHSNCRLTQDYTTETLWRAPYTLASWSRVHVQKLSLRRSTKFPPFFGPRCWLLCS
jgi:hypothetical protein